MWGLQYSKLNVVGLVLQKQMLRWSLGCKMFIRDQYLWREGVKTGLGGGRSQKQCRSTQQGALEWVWSFRVVPKQISRALYSWNKWPGLVQSPDAQCPGWAWLWAKWVSAAEAKPEEANSYRLSDCATHRLSANPSLKRDLNGSYLCLPHWWVSPNQG